MDREGTPATGSTDARLVSEVLDKHWIDINSTLHFIANLLNGHPTEVLNLFLWMAHMTYDLDTFYGLQCYQFPDGNYSTLVVDFLMKRQVRDPVIISTPPLKSLENTS